MKSLKIILSLAVLFFTVQTMDAQRTFNKGQADGKPQRVKEMRVEKAATQDTNKLEKAERKAYGKRKKVHRKGGVSQTERGKAKAKHGRKGTATVRKQNGKTIKKKMKGRKATQVRTLRTEEIQ